MPSWELVMNSLDQTWADKVEVAVLLAPIAYVEHMASPLKYLTPFLGMIDVSINNCPNLVFLIRVYV